MVFECTARTRTAMTVRPHGRLPLVSGGSSLGDSPDERLPRPIGGEETRDGLSIIDDEGTEWVWMFRTMTPKSPVQTFREPNALGSKGPLLPAEKAVTVFYVAAIPDVNGRAELWGSTRLGWRFRMRDLLHPD
jgi:hypothetical protein